MNNYAAWIIGGIAFWVLIFVLIGIVAETDTDDSSNITPTQKETTAIVEAPEAEEQLEPAP